MHIEVQVALNFVISYLYNKLPRRRVNTFGEELERALKDKFQGHWYPEKPFKGSAFRCLKTGDPVDAVFERAARESGVPIVDILENLPQELSVWVDPGEVSYRIGEKGNVKILYSETGEIHEETADREVIKTFNPEAQCFRPIDIGKAPSPQPSQIVQQESPAYKPTASPTTFIPRGQAPPLTFTTATFAQTKFGSTKLKTNSKRTNRYPNSFESWNKLSDQSDSAFYNILAGLRQSSSPDYNTMSPTEFSNYIKQRAVLQQQQQLHSPGRSMSPGDFNGFGSAGNYFNGHRGANIFDNFPDSLSTGFQQATKYFEHHTNTNGFYPNNHQQQGGGITNNNNNNNNINNNNNNANSPSPTSSQAEKQLLDSLNNFSLGNNYSSNQYQHLLVAN